MKKPEDFFFHIREKCFKGWDFAPKGWLNAPNEARAVIETQGSKVPPEDTLLSEMEKKI